jgi:hypothetical protein
MTSALDVRHLLTIDVDAEIRKLGRAPLGSVEQVPALLAARAIRSRASQIQVRLAPRRIEVRDDAGDLDPFRLADLAVLLSPGRSGRERHAALLALETAGCTALLALASLPEATGLLLESGRGAALAWRRGGPPALRAVPKASASRIAIDGVRLSRSGARRLLAETCRFAPARVTLDGEPLPKGFDGVLGEATLAAPLHGRVALPTGSEGDAHVWLLLDGAVMAHTSLPGLPAFVACLELGHLDVSSEPAALREAVQPLARPLASQALELLVRLARRPGHDAARAAGLRGHVLRAARRMPGAHELRRLPCLPTVPAPGCPGRLLNIAELGRLAAAGSVAALFPDQDARDYRTPGAGPLLLLDTPERSLLDRLAGARFVAPTRRWRPSRLRRLLARLRRAPSRARARLAALRPVRPLPEPQCTAEERALLAAVRAALPATGSLDSAGVCAGAGSPRARGRTLWLPRRCPDVIAAASALAREGDGFSEIAARALIPPREPAP